MLRPVSKWLFRGLAAALAALSIGLAILFWRLATDQPSLSFVTPYVNAALQDALPGYRITLGGTELHWRGLDAPLRVRAVDVRVAPENGASAAVIPDLQLDFALRPLLGGRLRLTGLEAIGAILHLTRGHDGAVGLTVMTERPGDRHPEGSGGRWDLRQDQAGSALDDEAMGAGGENAVLASLVADLLGEPSEPAGMLAHLHSIGVSDSRLVFDDAVAGRSWQADQVWIAAERRSSGIELRGAIVLDLGGDRRLPLDLRAFHRLGSAAADVRVSGGPVYPSELSGTESGWLRRLEAPLQFDVGFRLDGDGLPDVIDGRISSPLGRLRLPGLAAGVPLSLADLDLRFQALPQRQRLEVTALAVELGGSRVSGRGGIQLEGVRSGALADLAESLALARLSAADWHGRIEAIPDLQVQEGQLRLPASPAPTGLDAGILLTLPEPLLTILRYGPGEQAGPQLRAELFTARGGLTMPAQFDHQVLMEEVALTLAYDLVEARVDLVEARLSVDGVPVDASGWVEMDGAMPTGWKRGRLTAELGELDETHLLTLWPKALVPPTREWFVEHLELATIRNPQVLLDLQAADLAAERLSEGSVDVRFEVVDGVLHHLPPMSPIRDLSAIGQLTQDRFTLVEGQGRAEEVRLSDGSLLASGFQSELPRMEIRFQAQGGIPAMLEILDQQPLELSRRVGVAPRAIGGTADLDVLLQFPLIETLVPDDVLYSATGPLSGVSMAAAIGALDIRDGALQFSADRDALELRGQASLAGTRAELGWRQPLARDRPASYRLRATLEEAWRREQGFDLSPFLTGPLEAEVNLVAAPDGSGWELGASLDLERTALSVPALHLEKQPGRPAAAALRGRVDDDRLTHLLVDNLVTEDTEIGAALAFSGGKVSRIDLHRLIQGETSLSGWLQRGEDGPWSALLQGNSADLRPYLEGMSSPHRPEGGAASRESGQDAIEEVDADVVLNVATARVTDEFSLSDLAVELVLRNGQVHRLEGQAALNPAPGEPARDFGTLRLRMARDDDAIRYALNSDNAGRTLRALGFDKLRAGSLVAVGSAPASAPAAITARAVVRDARIVDIPRLQSLIAAPGSSTDTMDGPEAGIPVELAEVDARFSGEALVLDSLRARGPAVGLTMQGEIGLAADRAALTGTFVPAYALNRLFGQIPIIGDLLISREGEGLIGFTYRVTGPLGDPEVEVNPLSGLAPGFLRRLFEFTVPDLGGDNG